LYKKLEKIFKDRILKMLSRKDYYRMEVENEMCKREVKNSSKISMLSLLFAILLFLQE